MAKRIIREIVEVSVKIQVEYSAGSEPAWIDRLKEEAKNYFPPRTLAFGAHADHGSYSLEIVK